MKNIPDSARGLLAVKPSLIRVLGEGDDNELCFIELHAPGETIDVSMLTALILIKLAEKDLFTGLTPATVRLRDHPAKALLADHQFVKGGSTVHLCPTKGVDPETLSDKKADGQVSLDYGTMVYYGNAAMGFFLVVPHDTDILSWMCEQLALEPSEHQLTMKREGVLWIERRPVRDVKEQKQEGESGNGAPVFRNLGDYVTVKPTSSGAQFKGHGQRPFNPTPAHQVSLAKRARTDGVRDRSGDMEDADVFIYDNDNDTARYDNADGNNGHHAIESAVNWKPHADKAVIHMPDGSQQSYHIPPQGQTASELLRCICQIFGWNHHEWKLMEHGLPMTALHVDGGFSYDMRPRNKEQQQQRLHPPPQ